MVTQIKVGERISAAPLSKTKQPYHIDLQLPWVLQPPLPEQLFLPLQPLSLPLQPPWPLQLFLPAQECEPVAPLGALVPGALVLGSCARVLTAKPVINPVMAAVTRSVLCVLVMLSLILIVCFWLNRAKRRVRQNSISLATDGC
jgi:hypothetical protein